MSRRVRDAAPGVSRDQTATGAYLGRSCNLLTVTMYILTCIDNM